MADKKERCKFTIQFNASDPSQLQVVNLLNQQGRRKAQFITNAILHYLHCKETPDIPQPVPMDADLIESVVLRILKEEQHKSDNRQGTAQPNRNPITSHSEIVSTESIEALLGDKEGLAAIADTLSAFRNH